MKPRCVKNNVITQKKSGVFLRPKSFLLAEGMYVWKDKLPPIPSIPGRRRKNDNGNWEMTMQSCATCQMIYWVYLWPRKNYLQIYF